MAASFHSTDGGLLSCFAGRTSCWLVLRFGLSAAASHHHHHVPWLHACQSFVECKASADQLDEQALQVHPPAAQQVASDVQCSSAGGGGQRMSRTGCLLFATRTCAVGDTREGAALKIRHQPLRQRRFQRATESRGGGSKGRSGTEGQRKVGEAARAPRCEQQPFQTQTSNTHPAADGCSTTFDRQRGVEGATDLADGQTEGEPPELAEGGNKGRSGTEGNHRKTGREAERPPRSSSGGEPGPKASNQQPNHCSKAQHLSA